MPTARSLLPRRHGWPRRPAARAAQLHGVRELGVDGAVG